MENRPRNLFNPNHLHPSRHLRIHPGTTNRLLRSAMRKATIRGQHSRNESPPMHRGLEARAAASSSPGLAAGGRLDQAPQSQLQRHQDPLADPGKSPVEQASQNPFTINTTPFTGPRSTDVCPVFPNPRIHSSPHTTSSEVREG
ncbi:hypothetical protein MRX96_041203 [Rhipicephalus microplus]